MAKIKRSTRPTKKFMVEVGGKTIHFGASGMRIKSGTEAGDSYCARSAGIVTKKNSPNYFSRRMWGCVGDKSVKSKSLKLGSNI